MAWRNKPRSRAELLAVTPEYGALFNNLYNQLWRLPQIPATTLELCRLRIAQLHRNDSEWQREEVTLDQAQRDQLANWHGVDCFSTAEQACLGFTEVYAMDPQAITDELAEAVKAHYGEPGLVALIEALGLFYGLTRLSLLWQLSVPAGDHGSTTGDTR